MQETLANVQNLAFLYPDHPLLLVVEEREHEVLNTRRALGKAKVDLEKVQALRRKEKAELREVRIQLDVLERKAKTNVSAWNEARAKLETGAD